MKNQPTAFATPSKVDRLIASANLVLEQRSASLPADELAETVHPPLWDTARYARAYHQAGLNVIPLPDPREYLYTVPEDQKTDPLQLPKQPYLLNPAFTSRMHVCGSECWQKEQRTGRPCVSGIEDLDYMLETIPGLSHPGIGAVLGRTSGNLMAFDCDGSGLDRNETFWQFGRELAKFGIHPWAYTSARGGSYLLRVAEGEVANLDKSPFKGVQIWGYNRYQALPPSIHPSGVVYMWITEDPVVWPVGQPPTVSIEQLRRLGVRLRYEGGEPWETFGLPERFNCLSRRNREALGKGLPDGQRHTGLISAAYDLAGNQVPREEAEQVILQAAAKCQPPLPGRDAKAILNQAYRKPRKPARKGDAHISKRPGDTDWLAAREFALAHHWTGRTAQVDRAIFLACVERAKREGSPFRASCREIAKLANVSRPTASASLERLCSAGLLQPGSKDSTSHANTYGFTEEVRNFTTISASSTSGKSLDTQNATLPETPYEQDAYAGLGRVAWRVHQHLMTTPEPNASVIARVLGIGKSSVYEALPKLKQAGLAEFNPAESLWYGVEADANKLNEVAEQTGKAGRSEAWSELYKYERARHINRQMGKARCESLQALVEHRRTLEPQPAPDYAEELTPEEAAAEERIQALAARVRISMSGRP